MITKRENKAMGLEALIQPVGGKFRVIFRDSDANENYLVTTYTTMERANQEVTKFLTGIEGYTGELPSPESDIEMARRRQ